MSAFKQKMARLGVSASLLAVVSAAMLAISGIGASSAFATECPASTIEKEGVKVGIEGKGSSLQKIAQQEWTGREVFSNVIEPIPHPKLTGPERGYQVACPSAPVSYTSTGSGPGLTAFRFNGSGNIENGTHVGESHTFSYIGTDDAPTAAQIEHAKEATEGGVATGANPLIIPVAQTAIAVIYNPPKGCTVTFGNKSGISWTELGEIFNGVGKKEWSELGVTHSGTCGSSITRVVRAEGSGTTYQVKNYLAKLESEFSGANMSCSSTGFNEETKTSEATTEWGKTKAIGTGEEPNKNWPECVGGTSIVAQAGGGAVAKYVNEHRGTIGYAALPDAKANQKPFEIEAGVNIELKVARLQVELSEATKFYGTPEGAEEKANCAERVYSVPAAAQTSGTGEGVDWSKVFGATPNVGQGKYPLCTLTYDAAWSSYSKAGYTEAAKRAENVKDYLNYVVKEGQGIKKWYQPLPSPAEEAHNVLMAAEYAASKIG